jgi:hypothetical protein
VRAVLLLAHDPARLPAFGAGDTRPLRTAGDGKVTAARAYPLQALLRVFVI